jgi:hypothetical protein
MPIRAAAWAIGFLTGVGLAAALPESLFPAVRPLAFAAALLGIGLLGECAEAARIRRAATVRASARDLRPADGRVDIARLPGLRSEPNPHDPRFERFLEVDPDWYPADQAGVRSAQDSSARRSPPLLGRVVIFSVYIGWDGRTWTGQEVARSHEALLRASAWLEGEARRWGAPVNLELADVYFLTDEPETDEVAVGFVSEGESVGPIEEGASWKAVVAATRAAVRLGFRDAQHLCRTFDHRAGSDATVWLLHPRRAGRSIAVPREDAGLPGVSLAVCYAREASFPEPLTGPSRTDPVTVVHELLHLFGATDKYGRSLRSFEPESVTHREVMRLSESRLSRLRVDAGTALEIGWTRPEPSGPQTPTTAGGFGGRRRSSDQTEDSRGV